MVGVGMSGKPGALVERPLVGEAIAAGERVIVTPLSSPAVAARFTQSDSGVLTGTSKDLCDLVPITSMTSSLPSPFLTSSGHTGLLPGPRTHRLQGLATDSCLHLGHCSPRYRICKFLTSVKSLLTWCLLMDLNNPILNCNRTQTWDS